MKPSFIEFLTELTVSDDDPAQALRDVKKAARNPNQYKKQQQAQNVQDQRDIQKDKDDPLKTDRMRVAKMKQQLARQEKTVAQKEKRNETRAGI